MITSQSALKGTLIVCLIVGCVTFFLWPSKDEEATPDQVGPVSPVKKEIAQSSSIKAHGSVETPKAKKSKKPVLSEQEVAAAAVIEQHKEIDLQHLKQLHQGLFAYKKKYGHFPEYLSQLSPEFVSAEALTSPRGVNQGMNSFAKNDHPDPGVERPAYGYEFSNLEFRDGRTFAEIKEVQRMEWGDSIPILRAFGYDKVINMAYGGGFYETALNWEWDAATWDMVDKLGFGPGLNVGEFVKVRVAQPDGSPVKDAQVWADGRNYSFDLPNRPFATDADGWASIPVGADIDRTLLQLRATAPGLASPLFTTPQGELPEGQALVVEPTVRISGSAEGADGEPLDSGRVFLTAAKAKSDAKENGDSTSLLGSLGNVRTDANGKWQADVNPADLANLHAFVGQPGGNPVKHTVGAPVDAAAANSGKAVVTSKPH